METCKNLKEPTCGDSLPQTIKVNNRQTDAASDIIGELNTYFSSISDKLKAEYGHDDIPYNFSKLNEHVHAKIPLNVTFQIPCMKLPELLYIIKSLDTNKATGLDGISAKLLKSAAHVISPSLLEIINVSMVYSLTL